MKSGMSRKRFGHGLFPASLSLQDELDHFARGSTPAGPLSYEMADRRQFGRAIGYAHSQSGSLRQRNVGQIVAEIGDFRFGYAGFSHALLEGRGFLRLSQI